MSLLFYDSFESGGLTKWSSYLGASVVAGSSGPGNKDGVEIVYVGAGDYARKVIAAQTEAYISCFWANIGHVNLDVSPYAQFSFMKGSTVLAELRWTLDAGVFDDKKFHLYIGGSQVAVGTYVYDSPYNQWIHLQLRYKMASSGGYFQLKVDDVLDASYENADTTPGADTDFDTIQLGIGGYQVWYDSFVLNNADGSGLTGWPGVVRIKTQAPTGDSATNNAWSKSTGVNGYALVDEVPANNTDYVYSATNGQKQGFTYPATGLGAEALIKAIGIDAYSQKISSGQLKLGYRIGSTDYIGSAKDLATAWRVETRFEESSPAGGAWAYDSNPELTLESVI